MGVIGDFRVRGWVFIKDSLTLSNDGCGQNMVFSDHDVEEESFSLPTLLTNISSVFKFKMEHICAITLGARPFKRVLVQRIGRVTALFRSSSVSVLF